MPSSEIVKESNDNILCVSVFDLLSRKGVGLVLTKMVTVYNSSHYSHTHPCTAVLVRT